MSPLSSLRRAPWLAGALVLALLAGLLAPLAAHFGLRRWPFYVGLGAGLVLLLGWLERLWQGRALSHRFRLAERTRDRGRFRVVPGGKGNGHAHDQLEDDDGDTPRWLM
jgi:hypothetical protein